MDEYRTAFDQLNIPQEVFDQIITDDSARGEIHEFLVFCLTSVPSLSSIASVLLQYIACAGSSHSFDDEKWITINGTHVAVEEGSGAITKGPAALKAASAKKTGSDTPKRGESAFTPRIKDYAFEYEDEYTDGPVRISELDPSEQYEYWRQLNMEKLRGLFKEERQKEKETGVKRPDFQETVYHEWYGSKTENVTPDTVQEMSLDKAKDVLWDTIPDNVASGWLREANSAYKPRLVDCVIATPETRAAALNVMYENYKFFNGEGTSFEDFLTTPVRMYRGGQGQKHVAEDVFSSYTLDRKIAEKFAGKNGTVYEASIRPIDTWGSLRDNGEAEIMVPSWIAPNGNKDNADGGPGSGNHGHAGVPGQVGGSAPGPFGKLSDDAVAIIKAHLNSPMHFGETDEQKAASQKTLVESLKKSGISVSYDEDKYPWPYRALSTDLTYQENLQMNQALNQTQWVAGVNREQYIDACREEGKEPRLSETPIQVSEWALYSKSGKLQSDGTPVYSSLDKESLLSDADLIEYAGNDSYLSPEKNEAVKKAAASAIENMTEVQLKACNNYSKQFSSTNYQAVNDYLATGQGSPEAAEAAKQMTEALDHTIGAPCICSRGAAGFFGTENDAAISKLVAKVAKGDFSAAGKLKASLEGKTLSSKTVMSTSPGDALDGFDKAPVQMIFKVPANAKGVNITAVSAFGGGRSEVEKKLAATGMFGAVSHESEVAFKPGTRYTIERVEYALSTDGKKKKGQVYVVASILPETSNNDGGPGSGNFGHSGVPGQVGVSAPGNGSRAVVNGSDISRSYSGKPDINSVMEAQGFTGWVSAGMSEDKNADSSEKPLDFMAQSDTIKSRDQHHDADDVDWITVNGAHIPLKDGTAVGGGALEGQDFSASSSTSSSPSLAKAHWPDDFPKVTVHTNLQTLRHVNPERHHAAKHGDTQAAKEIIAQCVKMERVEELANKYPDAKVVPVRGEDTEEGNQIPMTFASCFEAFGLEVEDGIVQTKKAGHTDSDQFHRLMSRPEFDGKVEPGREYILVDDHVTNGGTLNDLRKYIVSNGGKVVAISTLSASQGGTYIAIQKKTVDQIRSKHGEGIDSLLRKGGIAYDVESLTDKEGRYILSMNPDTLKRRIEEDG